MKTTKHPLCLGHDFDIFVTAQFLAKSAINTQLKIPKDRLMLHNILFRIFRFYSQMQFCRALSRWNIEDIHGRFIASFPIEIKY